MMTRPRPGVATLGFLLAVIGTTAANAAPGDPPPNNIPTPTISPTPAINITCGSYSALPGVQVTLAAYEEQQYEYAVTDHDTITPIPPAQPYLWDDRARCMWISVGGNTYVFGAQVTPAPISAYAHECTYTVTVMSFNDTGWPQTANFSIGWDDEASLPGFPVTGSSDDEQAWFTKWFTINP